MCPFGNFLQKKSAHHGEGLTTEFMNECRWLKPKLVAQVELTEWTKGIICGTRLLLGYTPIKIRRSGPKFVRAGNIEVE